METKEIFANRLLEIRESKHLARQKVADDLGITRASLEYYEKGKRTPDLNTISKISDYFGVSIDYLMGKSDCTSYDLGLQGMCKYLGVDVVTAIGISNVIKSNKKYQNEIKAIISSSAFSATLSYIFVSWDYRKKLGKECLYELKKVTEYMEMSAEELFNCFGEDGYYSDHFSKYNKLQNEIELNEYRAEKHFTKDLLNCNSKDFKNLGLKEYEIYLDNLVPNENLINNIEIDIDMATDNINKKINQYIEQQHKMDED